MSCEGCGKIYTAVLEQFVYGEMVNMLEAFQTLQGRNASKADLKLTALNVELAQVEAEIEKLVDTLTGANSVLLSYANVKIEALDTQRQALIKEIADRSVETVSQEQIDMLSNYLDDWENVSFDDKRQVVDGLINRIAATCDKVEIEWKI